MLTATGRRLRLGGLFAAVVLLLLGTLVGTDDDFPFGPFRMYATADPADGQVLSTTLEAVTADHQVVSVGEADVGLRRAEYEGQLSRLTPAVLAQLVAVHAHRRPEDPPWVALRVVQAAYALHHGEPSTRSRRVLTAWPAR